jgi:hypothetical protein
MASVAAASVEATQAGPAEDSQTVHRRRVLAKSVVASSAVAIAPVARVA